MTGDTKATTTTISNCFKKVAGAVATQIGPITGKYIELINTAANVAGPIVGEAASIPPVAAEAVGAILSVAIDAIGAAAPCQRCLSHVTNAQLSKKHFCYNL